MQVYRACSNLQQTTPSTITLTDCRMQRANFNEMQIKIIIIFHYYAGNSALVGMQNANIFGWKLFNRLLLECSTLEDYQIVSSKHIRSMHHILFQHKCTFLLHKFVNSKIYIRANKHLFSSSRCTITTRVHTIHIQLFSEALVQLHCLVYLYEFNCHMLRVAHAKQQTDIVALT